MRSESRWQGSFLQRAKALIQTQRMQHDSRVALRRQLYVEGLSLDQIEHGMALAKKAQRAALLAAHYDDVRALLSTWRWLHRWTALTMFLLVLVHVWTAMKFGSFLG